MSADRQQAIQYLRAPERGLWRWTEDGKVLEWNDSSTIAFREEIVHILEWLAPNGLPPFGALVFLLAACRGKVAKVAEVVAESSAPLPTKMGYDATVLLSARRQLRAQLEVALVQLGKVSQLPSELNTGLKARCVLAEAVFEPAKAERHVEARAVLHGLRELVDEVNLADDQLPSVTGSYLRQIHIVAEGLKLHTVDSLALRLRTGLDALPKEADLELPTAERARRLIEELSKDRDCGAVARAARELLAAVRLPRRLAEREQLSLGGVADITNRGPLDRLLLSELAHDDLTLATRVALNEALYLRREPPMREPPGTLALLLDSGVRLWGIPRVLATAVALALIARDKQHRQVLSWRAHGKELASLDLLSRNGLTQHLGTLETEAHPGASLPAFAEAVEEGAEHQSVLITHRDCLDDPELRRSLAEHPAAPGFVATVDRAGHFELHALPLARRPPVCEADLNLDEVFDKTTGTPPVRTEVDPSLPAIFGVTPFPFLLPVAGRIDSWTKADDGSTCALLNDRRLVRFRDQQVGAYVLSEKLPGGKTVWMEVMRGDVHIVKSIANQRPSRLLTQSLEGGELRVNDLVTGPEIFAVHRYGDVILLIRKHETRAYALSDGRFLSRSISPVQWIHGRYFRGEGHFYFVTWNGLGVKYEPVTLPASISFSAVRFIFDRPGREGPWLFLANGHLVSLDLAEDLALPIDGRLRFDFRAVQISRDGNQLLLPAANRDGAKEEHLACVYGLDQRVTYDLSKHPEHFFDKRPPLPSWNLFRVVENVARVKDGLAICGRKGRWRKIGLSVQGKLEIRELPTHERGELQAQAAFDDKSKSTSHGCTLQRAEWSSGSKVFLDSRGLLHLKSHDPTIPEVSLAMAEGEVAGWTSDGFVCGPKFFFDGPHQSEPVRVFERLLQFLVRL